MHIRDKGYAYYIVLISFNIVDKSITNKTILSDYCNSNKIHTSHTGQTKSDALTFWPTHTSWYTRWQVVHKTTSPPLWHSKQYQSWPSLSLNVKKYIILIALLHKKLIKSVMSSSHRNWMSMFYCFYLQVIKKWNSTRIFNAKINDWFQKNNFIALIK